MDFFIEFLVLFRKNWPNRQRRKENEKCDRVIVGFDFGHVAMHEIGFKSGFQKKKFKSSTFGGRFEMFVNNFVNPGEHQQHEFV